MSSISICLPMHFRVDGDHYYAATPRGFRDRAFFEAIAESDLRSPPPAFAGSFPWWVQDTDNADFFDGLADVLCWTVVPWRAPDNDIEVELFRATVEVLKRCTPPERRDRRAQSLARRKGWARRAASPSRAGVPPAKSQYPFWGWLECAPSWVLSRRRRRAGLGSVLVRRPNHTSVRIPARGHHSGGSAGRTRRRGRRDCTAHLRKWASGRSRRLLTRRGGRYNVRDTSSLRGHGGPTGGRDHLFRRIGRPFMGG